MERKFTFSVDEYYHVYSRGVEKRKIFYNEKDYKRFISLLYLANTQKSFHLSNLTKTKNYKDLFELDREKTLTSVGCYCLMPNHFHLLLKETEDGGISKFVGKLLTGYSMYFNTKMERSGPLFVRPFRAKHANSDNYLKYLFAYIHLNPLSINFPKWQDADNYIDLKLGKKFITEYLYSSYPDYIEVDRVEKNILDKGVFPDYFENPKDFEDFIKDWLEIKKLVQPD